MSTVSSPNPTRSPIGAFHAEAHAAHLASLAGLPAWLAERKRTAQATFASLPLPRRTDEMWRFSDITEIRARGH
jgi:Fe-S cluster assembly protein SufD